MSRTHHPAGTGRTCVTPHCGQRGVALVTVPTGPVAHLGTGLAIVRPANSPEQRGRLLCTDCMDITLGLMLMGPMPEASR